MNVVTPYAEVIRRVGGLEVADWLYRFVAVVIRRVGGLEARADDHINMHEVIRRVGGLEVSRSSSSSHSCVIRRVGGLEVYASNAEKFGEVIRRVGGLKMFHHAHFSRSSAILPPGHWLLIQYMTSANSLRLKMREKRRSPALTLCRACE